MTLQKKVISFILLISLLLSLTGCFALFARIILPRNVSVSLLNASRLGMRSVAGRAILTSTLGRATAFSFLRTRLLQGGRIILKSQSGRTLASITKKGNKIDVFLKGGKKPYIIRSILTKNKKIINHYDFQGQKIGYSKTINNNKIVHYSKTNKKLGFDISNSDKTLIKHYDERGNYLYPSRFKKHKGVWQYKGYDNNTAKLLNLYMKHVVYNDKKANKAYFELINAIKKCHSYNYTQGLSEVCEKMQDAYDKVDSLTR